jgi:hypothetical protein
MKAAVGTQRDVGVKYVSRSRGGSLLGLLGESSHIL